MRIGILGATKGIGLELTRQALHAEHTVTVLVRRGQAPEARNPHLKAVRGDARDQRAVNRLVQGCDTIIMTLGIPPTFRPVSLFSQATRNVLNAMWEYQVQRLLVVTGIGTGDSQGHGGFLYDKVILPTFLKTIYQNKEKQEEMVRGSETEWTIVRPAFLTNGPQTGSFQTLTSWTRVKNGGKISRKDVAYFLLREAKQKRHLEKTVMLMR